MAGLQRLRCRARELLGCCVLRQPQQPWRGVLLLLPRAWRRRGAATLPCRARHLGAGCIAGQVGQIDAQGEEGDAGGRGRPRSRLPWERAAVAG